MHATERRTENSKIKVGFRKGRGTDEVRYIVEKTSEFRKDVAFDFVNLVHAFEDILEIPRELPFGIMR